MKNILITGAFGGMGNATTKKFLENGYRVFALDKTTPNDHSDNLIPIECNITDHQSIERAFEIVSKHTVHLDGIIHLCGMYMMNSLVEIEREDFEKIFKVNVEGAYLINKIFLPLLYKGSKITIVTSELAPLTPLPFTGVYAITKKALDAYAQSLRMELQLFGVPVVAVRAGAVDTNMLGASTKALDDFVNGTTHYKCNATKFKHIVDSVESKSISPNKLAELLYKISLKVSPKMTYNINRNPLLRLLNILPKKMQFGIIKKVLK